MASKGRTALVQALTAGHSWLQAWSMWVGLFHKAGCGSHIRLYSKITEVGHQSSKEVSRFRRSWDAQRADTQAVTAAHRHGWQEPDATACQQP